MNNFYRGLALILIQVIPLALGYTLKKRGVARESWGRPLSRFVIWFFNTSVCFLAAWVLPMKLSMFKLPAVAVVFAVAITFIAVLMSRIHPKHSPPDRGAYIVGSVISNYGFTLGGFICFIFLGETALSMQTVYIFPLVAFIYLVWFPIARYYGTAGDAVSPLKSFLMAFRDITTLPLAGTLAGLSLNFLSLKWPAFARPSFLEHVNAVLVWTGTAASTFTIGVTLQVDSVLKYRLENATVAVTKFLTAPLLGYALAKAFGADRSQLQVVVILSIVPVGLFTSFASSIFGLNRNLANSLFVVNTAVFLALILPLLVWLLPHIG
ncbi:MAG: hypothetical protein JW909_13810 [Planctomycetes bacterium]|nr:hypothetical protein [Planctomycetota bacterium]